MIMKKIFFLNNEFYGLNSFQVPPNFGIAQTFDLFLKVHETIGLGFEPNLKPMAHFCLQFIYGVQKINRPSPLLENLRDSMKIIEP